MPWNDDELSPETNLITEQLEAINKRGVLTINSQPNVNGAPSSDSKVGWGSPNGYIYQKVRICFWITYFLYFETLFKFSSHGIHKVFIFKLAGLSGVLHHKRIWYCFEKNFEELSSSELPYCE